MKVLRICPEMPAFADLRSGGLGDWTFAELANFYRNENLIFPGGWRSSALELGHEVIEVVYADYFSQSLWLQEHCPHASFGEARHLDYILLEQVRYYQPDLVIYYTGVMYRISSELRRRIRKILNPKAVTLAIWGDEIPVGLEPLDFFSDVDLVGACTVGYHKHFQSVGLKTFLMESAFDTEFSYTIENQQKSNDVLFIGNTGFGEPDHQRRYRFLDRLLARNNNVYFYGFEKKQKIWNNSLFCTLVILFIRVLALVPNKPLDKLKKLGGRLAPSLHFIFEIAQQVVATKAKNNLIRKWVGFEKYSFDSKPLSRKYKKRYRGKLQSGADYFAKLSSAKISINFHRDEANDFGNIRCFETMGVGTLLLTDRAGDISHLFDEDEFVGFDTVEECSEKIDFLLSNPQKLEEIAQKGQKKVLAKHTVMHRLVGLFNAVEGEVKHRVNAVEGEVKHRGGAVKSLINTPELVMIYDASRRPISFDYAFFLQYCKIKMSSEHPGKRLKVFIAMPETCDDFQKKYFWSFDEMRSRIDNILVALHKYFPDIIAEVIHVSGDISKAKATFLPKEALELIPLEEQPHHREFYCEVNRFPDKIQPLVATKESKAKASKFINGFRKSFAKVFSVTIRNSIQSPERNSNIAALQTFASKCAFLNIGLVVLPDTDNRSELPWPKNVTVIDGDEIRDFDYRMAIYECCDDNVFVNNGPCVASELNPNITSKMFKLVVPSVPHCTVEFIESQGYENGKSPKYNQKAKWIWQDDDVEVLIENLI